MSLPSLIPRSSLPLALAAWLLFFLLMPAQGCPIPVYQYALEHWPAEDYLLEFYMPAAAQAEEVQALEYAQQLCAKPGKIANVALRRLEEPPAGSAPEKACLQLRYPARYRQRPPLWQGALSKANLERIMDSPFRRRLGRALAERTSVVWILLQGGKAQRDAKTKALVQKNLDALIKEVDIPEQADWGGQMMEIDANVNFSLLNLSRDDPEEEIFLSMLLGSEADLRSDFLDQPLLFPVFGRGILLYALVADGINRWTLSKAISFLTGSCSCQVKAANPGLDLLLSIDWERLVVPMTSPTAGGTVGVGEFLRAKEAEELKADRADPALLVP
jgi:hypothetical protein